MRCDETTYSHRLHRPAPIPIPRAVTSSTEVDGGNKIPSSIQRNCYWRELLCRAAIKINEKVTLYKIKLEKSSFMYIES